MLIKKPVNIAPSEITPKDLYLNRRKFLLGASAMAGAAALGGLAACQAGPSPSRVAFADTNGAGTKIEGTQKSSLSTAGERLTPLHSRPN